jgi:hypothetical protein
LTRFEFESETRSFVLLLSLFRLENRVCLSHGVQVAGGRCDMTCSDEDHDRSRKPGAEDRGWSYRSGTWWPDDRKVG